MRRLLVLLALSACAPRLSLATSQALTAALSTAPQPGSDDPEAPRSDLGGLREIVGAARVVGLGQPGPGARELTRLHHRVLRLLVEETGFTGLALDIDATAALALDAFVSGLDIDIDAALLAPGDRGLATVEMRAVMLYLRGQNARPGRSIRVFGLAPDDPEAAAAVALDYLQVVDLAYVPAARSLLAGTQQLGVDAVRARLDERRADYVARSDAQRWTTARQQTELVAQARRMAETWEFEAGEFARARNAEWALAQLGPAGKLVVWADNRRVARQVPGAAPAMGDFLNQWLLTDYRALAASFGEGSLLATRDEHTLCGVALPPPRARSLDAALVGAGEFTVLDLRARSEPELRRPQVLRSLAGGRAEDSVLRPTIAFDAILGLRHVHPSIPLGVHASSAAAGPCYTLIPAP